MSSERTTMVMICLTLGLLAAFLWVSFDDLGAHDDRDTARYLIALHNSEQVEEHTRDDVHYRDCRRVEAASVDCSSVIGGKPARYRCNYQRCAWLVKP